MVDATKMEVGGSGTVKAEFKDAFDKESKAKSVFWAANGGLVITADEKDPASASFYALQAGPATITATVEGEHGGRLTLDHHVMVVEKDNPVTGKLEVSVKPAPAKAEPAKAEHAAPTAHATTHETKK